MWVDLWLGPNETVNAVRRTQDQIATHGLEGWEPVGEVCFQFSASGRTDRVAVRQLMFKRPV